MLSHQADSESVSIQVVDGIACSDETDKPANELTDHSRNGRVRTLCTVFNDRFIVDIYFVNYFCTSVNCCPFCRSHNLLCALILLETSALYKLFTYLLSCFDLYL